MITTKHRKTMVSAAIAAACLSTASAAQGPEQFFLDDGTAPVQTATTSDGETRYEIRSGYAIVEGDIVLGKVLGDGEPLILPRGIGRNSKLDRWIDGIVYYELAASLKAADVQKVRDAVNHWNQFSSLRFTERVGSLQATQSDYILFEPSSGCASWVGKIGGEQAIWVGESCTAGSVIHEIGHAVGLFHEHTRTDRDSYIDVAFNNVLVGKEFNFDVMDVGADDLGSYDYGSIMHYGAAFFSRNGQPTIKVPDGVEIGQRDALSQADLQSIDGMYKTDLMLSYSSTSDASMTTVNFTVNNIGDNGANTITLSIPQSSASGMLSFSGTGWNCTNGTQTATCDLDTLADGAESTLVVNMQNDSVDANNLQAFVNSKSFDSDLGNNGSVPEDNPPLASALPDRDGNGVTDVLPVNTGGGDAVDSEGSNTGGSTDNPANPGTPGGQTVSSANSLPDTDGNGTPDQQQTGSQSAAGSSDTPELGAANPPNSGGGGAGWPLMMITLVALRRFLRPSARNPG